jgi:uncharacterized protein
MNELLISPYIIALVFFIVAFVYSSVGLGGGSSYTALMAMIGFSTLAIPMVSLILNLMVTTVGSYNFIRRRHARLRLILPFAVTSIPMAYFGGTLQLPAEIFYLLLLLSLVLVAVRIYFMPEASMRLNISPAQKYLLSLLIGAALGFIAGTVGIGGGIYLVPLILILGLGNAREAAASGAIFIWINSLFGLASRLQYNAMDLQPFIPLLVAVVIGGTMGSWLGANRYQPRTMEKILGVIIILAIVALARNLLA